MEIHRLRTMLFCGSTVFVALIVVNCDLYFANTAFRAMTDFLKEEAKLNNRTLDSNSLAGVWSSFLSLSFFSMIFSAITLPTISDKFGRKKALLICLIGAAPGRLMSFLADVLTNSYWLFFGRFASCFFDWMLVQLIPLILCEITEPEVRGRMNSIVTAAFVIGTVFAVTMGLEPFFGNSESWSKGYLFFFILGLLPIPGALILKETPVFLAANDANEADILDSLIYYYGDERYLFECRMDAENAKSESKGFCKHVGRMFGLFKVSALWPQLLVVAIMGCGYSTLAMVNVESTIMLIGVGFSSSTAAVLTVALKSIGAVTAVVVIFISESFNRRLQFLTTIWVTTGAFLTCLITKILYDAAILANNCENFPLRFMNDESNYTIGGDWMELKIASHGCFHTVHGLIFAAAQVLIQIAGALGVRPLFWILVTEVFPHHYRASAKGVSFLAYGLFSFIGTLLFGMMLQSYGGLAYLFFVIPTFLCSVVSQCFMPDTRAKHPSNIFTELTSSKTPKHVSNGIFYYED